MKEIPLSRGAVAVVDDADFPRLRGHAWHVTQNGYAKTTLSDRRDVLMHRMILDAPRGALVDHIDGDKLNNRRGNLRFATRAQNAANMNARRGGRSQYKGVYWQTQNGRWFASITVFGRQIYLGTFDTEEQAATAYDVAAAAHFGEYARLNFPPSREMKEAA